jgi:hypothetical protein
MAGLGYFVVRFSQPRHTMQTKGIADRRYYKRDAWPDGSAHVFWFECKRPGEKQRPSQKEFERLVTECRESYVAGDRDALVRHVIDHAPIGRLQQLALRVQFGIPVPADKAVEK